MSNFREMRIIKRKVAGDKIWEIISYLEDEIKKFDVVYYNKSDANIIAEELISSKKRVETFRSEGEAVKFIEKQN